eukprot:Nk52_evm50s296 gene=Nk52_evmTU50s296
MNSLMFDLFGHFGGKTSRYNEELGIDYGGFNEVSQSALRKLEKAKNITNDFMAWLEVNHPDPSKTVTCEIINFHLVSHCQKEFRAFCQKLNIRTKTRKTNVSGRKSQVCLFSVIVSPNAFTLWKMSKKGGKATPVKESYKPANELVLTKPKAYEKIPKKKSKESENTEADENTQPNTGNVSGKVF